MKSLGDLTAGTTYMGDLHLGCLKACLDRLGFEISTPWLAGTTGQTFVISIDWDICLSSVWCCWGDAYADGTMARLGCNLGYNLELVHVDGDDPDVPAKMANAWKRFREAIDAGHPCYSYYNFCYQLLTGYDEEGFYIGGGATNAGQGPVSMLDMGGIELYVASPGGPPADDRTAAREGLLFALQHAHAGNEGQPHDINSDDAHGLAAYDRWIAALEAGNEGGTWRAIDHYVRCREFAVKFLEEAEERLPKEVSPLVSDARSLYQSVCDNLWPVSEAFGEGKEPIPFNEPGSPHAEAADRLRSARDAETKGLEILEQIAAAL